MTIRECTESGATLEIPININQYQVVKVIGTGSTAIVVQLLNNVNGEHFAAKVVSREEISKNGRIEYFERELRVLQNIQHPNIIKIIDIIYMEKIIAVVMEYCMYGDLLSFITDRNVLPPTLCRHMFYQIVLAVGHLHQRNFVHRDLKLENIFVNSNYDIKLGDFGLTKEAMNKKTNLLSTVCGTLYYTAPEIILNQKYDGKKTDIWSLGIILYCLGAGSLPWQSTNEGEIRDEIVNGISFYPPTIYPDLLKCIANCCKVDPNERWDIQDIINSDYLAIESRNGQRIGVRGFSMKFGSSMRQTSNGLVQPQTRNDSFAYKSAQMIIAKPGKLKNQQVKYGSTKFPAPISP